MRKQTTWDLEIQLEVGVLEDQFMIERAIVVIQMKALSPITLLLLELKLPLLNKNKLEVQPYRMTIHKKKTKITVHQEERDELNKYFTQTKAKVALMK